MRKSAHLFVVNIFIGIKGCLGLATNCYQLLVLCIIDTGTFSTRRFLLEDWLHLLVLLTVRRVCHPFTVASVRSLQVTFSHDES